jgi:DNA-binding NarL/FixJ family response regulator
MKDMKLYMVEDDESIRIILKRILKRKFSAIRLIGESDNAEEALLEIPSFAPDLILVDLTLPGMDGIELIKKLKPIYPNGYILVMTNHDVGQIKNAALEAGADEIVLKINENELLLTIEKLLTCIENKGC